MYTPIQVAKVFREIRKALLLEPLVFTKEGVFRVPGHHDQARLIVENILTNQGVKMLTPRNADKYPVHDYISALKLVLDESNLQSTHTPAERLKEALSKGTLSEGAQALFCYIESLIQSPDLNEHAAGEVFYTYMQLAKHALTFQQKNKMTAQNLGIVLGPNFEKMINTDPTQTLPLILKLNSICEAILNTEALTVDFDHRYAPTVIKMKEMLLEKLEAEKSKIKYLRKTYQDKISEYNAKIASQKSALGDKSQKANKKMILNKIEEYEKIIALYQKDDSEGAQVKLKAIKKDIEMLTQEIKALKKKYPATAREPAFNVSDELKNVTRLLAEIKEFITDDEGEMESSPFPTNLLMRSSLKTQDAPKASLLATTNRSKQIKFANQRIQ